MNSLENDHDETKLTAIEACRLTLTLAKRAEDEEEEMQFFAAFESLVSSSFPDVSYPLFHPTGICHICPHESMTPINKDGAKCVICNDIPCEAHIRTCDYKSCNGIVYCSNCVNQRYGSTACLECYEESLPNCKNCGDKIPFEKGVFDLNSKVQYCSDKCLAQKLSLGKCTEYNCQKHGIGECYFCDMPACRSCGRVGGLNQPDFFHRYCLP